MIIDSFNRSHKYLRISLTERCNLRCFYCMPPEGIALRARSEFMQAEEIDTIVGEFVTMGVNKVRLTGGEPLIRKDIDIILRNLAKHPVDLAITTNGVIVDRFIDLFKEVGLKNINLSLDTLDKGKMERITFRDHYDRILSNLDLLINKGFNVKINCVLIKGTNDDEIIDFINLTKDKNIEVRFIEFMPFDGNSWDKEKCISLEEVKSVTNKHYGVSNVSTLELEANHITKKFKITGYAGTFGVISSVSNPFCDSCNRIRLTADGKIRNCLFSNTETDLLSALRNNEEIRPLILGNVKGKFAKWGGIAELKKDVFFENGKRNRSMTTIGG